MEEILANGIIGLLMILLQEESPILTVLILRFAICVGAVLAVVFRHVLGAQTSVEYVAIAIEKRNPQEAKTLAGFFMNFRRVHDPNCSRHRRGNLLYQGNQRDDRQSG